MGTQQYRHRQAIEEVLQAAAGKTIGMAWYTRESWRRLADVADDGGTGYPSFEEWERDVEEGICQMASAGADCRKVFIDIDALLAWCRLTGRKNDSQARAGYVEFLLRKRSGCAQDEEC